MKLENIVEALGLGAAREARQLVERLPGPALTVVTLDGAITRALERAGHRPSPPDPRAGDAALALGLPDGDAALAAIERLWVAVRAGGTLGVVCADTELERARVAGLFVRVGVRGLRQEVDGGLVFTLAEVAPLPARS
jgi:hypothetical protein